MTATTHYGPYNVTDYKTWQAALDAGVSAASQLVAIRYGPDKVIFVEVAGS